MDMECPISFPGEAGAVPRLQLTLSPGGTYSKKRPGEGPRPPCEHQASRSPLSAGRRTEGTEHTCPTWARNTRTHTHNTPQPPRRPLPGGGSEASPELGSVSPPKGGMKEQEEGEGHLCCMLTAIPGRPLLGVKPSWWRERGGCGRRQRAPRQTGPPAPGLHSEPTEPSWGSERLLTGSLYLKDTRGG